MTPNRKTLQERVYEALADGPMSVRQLTERVGASSQEHVSNILCVLRRKGITSPDGPGSPKVKHYRLPGAPHPKTVRDPGAWVRVGRVKVKPEQPAIPCALAECWGWQPSPTKLQRRKESVLLGRGTVRLQET